METSTPEKWYFYHDTPIEVSTLHRARIGKKMLRLQDRFSKDEPYLLTVPPGCGLPKWSVINIDKALRECIKAEKEQKEEEKKKREQLELDAAERGGRRVYVYEYPSLLLLEESYDNLLHISGYPKVKLEGGGFRKGDRVYTYFKGDWAVKFASERRLPNDC